MCWAGVIFLSVLASSQAAPPPDTVMIHSGTLSLRGLLWRPPGHGSFPAVLFNHGSYRSGEGNVVADAAALGPVFARHGYVVLVLFRRGVGLSADQGAAGGDVVARALEEGGPEARNRTQIALLAHDELSDVVAGLNFLRSASEVDRRRIAVVGHSFGGSLTLLLAAQDTAVRAVVLFGAAAASWDQSPELRERLESAVRHVAAPVLFIHAANDYSVSPGRTLADEMQRLHRPHRLVIYPAFGTTAAAGHNLVYRSTGTWEADVFGFLDAQWSHP